MAETGQKALPKVSIIVPVYNTEKYLRRCLDSIAAQTFTDWECICVDDGSLDASGAICDEYAAKDSRFVVIQQENGVVSRARNARLDKAHGVHNCQLIVRMVYLPYAEPAQTPYRGAEL